MLESTDPRVLLLTRDEPERAILERQARTFGAVAAPTGARGPGTDGNVVGGGPVRIQSGCGRTHRLVQDPRPFDRPADDALYPRELNQVGNMVLAFSGCEVSRGDTHLEQALLPRFPRVPGPGV